MASIASPEGVAVLGERESTRRLARGVAAGAGAALALVPADALERRILGREPVFALQPVTRRLLARVAGHRPRGSPLALEWALRLGYGMGLGAALAISRWSAPAAALAITGLELWAMPAAGATPPARSWSARERWLLLAHASVFALAATTLLGRRR